MTFLSVDFAARDQSALLRDLRVTAHPTTLVLDGEGREVARFLGPMGEAELAAAVAEALAR